jgi:8-oxo-dGTP pyrophosphatase MutT (NUDIX family)
VEPVDAVPLSLQRLLDAHRPEDADEAQSLAEMRRLLPSLAQPLSRRQADAHFTASALVVDTDAGKVALLHHAKLRRWLQPGGHAEPGDGGSMYLTALREAREETGCEVRLHEAAPSLIDVDVHPIPARAGEPAHRHLDLRFLLVAEDPRQLTLNADESSALGWFTFDDAAALVDDDALRRLIVKGRRTCKS